MKEHNRFFLTKLAVNLVLMGIGCLLIILFLNHMQNATSRYKQRKDSLAALEDVISVVQTNARDVEELTAIYHNENQQTVNTLKKLLLSGLYNNLTEENPQETARAFGEVTEHLGSDYLFVMDEEGTILLSANVDTMGVSLIDQEVLTEASLHQLIAQADADYSAALEHIKKEEEGEEAIADTENSGEQEADAELSQALARIQGVGEEASSEQNANLTNLDQLTTSDEQAAEEEEVLLTEITPVTASTDTGKYYFYSAALETEGQTCYLVLGEESSILDLQFSSMTDIGKIISNITVGEEGFLFAIDSQTNSFIYYDDGVNTLSGQDIFTCGLNEDIMADNYAGTQKILGTPYYCITRTYDDYTFISAALTTSELYGSNTKTLFWSVTGFLMVTIVTMLYGIFLRNDSYTNNDDSAYQKLFTFHGNEILLQKVVLKAVIPVIILGVFLIFGISLYSQTLLDLSDAVKDSASSLEDVEGKLTEAENTRKTIEDYYDSRYLDKAGLIAYLLEEVPYALNETDTRPYFQYNEDGLKEEVLDDEGHALQSVLHSESLQQLCEANDLEEIYIFDKQGRTIATNGDNWYYQLSLDPEDPSYEFREVLDAHVDSYVQERTTDENGEMTQYIGTSFTYYTYTLDIGTGKTMYASSYDYEAYAAGNWTGNPITRHDSMLLIKVNASTLDKILETTQVSYILEDASIMNNGILFAFDNTEEHAIVYSPEALYLGKTAEELGISQKAFSGSYNGFQSVNGVTYFMCYRYNDGYYIATAMAADTIYEGRFNLALVTMLVSAGFLLLIMSMVVLSTQKEERMYQEMMHHYRKNMEKIAISINLPSGKSVITSSAASRWNGKSIPWREKTPIQKLLVLLKICFSLVLFYLLVTILFAKFFFGGNSIILYIISGNWDKGFNIFALSACAIVLVMTILGFTVIQALVGLVTAVLGQKSETIGHLLISISKYGGTIGAVFFGLYLMGLDGTPLVASASILSLVIGLGSQSLIKDIIAGMFIVFEGEFQVGDIVTVNDYRGQVLDIGLRTTKIINVDKNIKIFNNSDISGVINMTRETSLAYCYVGIDYGEDLVKVEKILEEEFPHMREEIPEIIYGPNYMGVDSLADSAVVLKLNAHCKESDIDAMKRKLNRAVFLALKKHNINIPFPQVTLSNREE